MNICVKNSRIYVVNMSSWSRTRPLLWGAHSGPACFLWSFFGVKVAFWCMWPLDHPGPNASELSFFLWSTTASCFWGFDVTLNSGQRSISGKLQLKQAVAPAASNRDSQRSCNFWWGYQLSRNGNGRWEKGAMTIRRKYISNPLTLHLSWLPCYE